MPLLDQKPSQSMVMIMFGEAGRELQRQSIDTGGKRVVLRFK